MSDQLTFFDDDRAADPPSAETSTRPLPPDEAARERIRHDLEATLFVEAGAGAGKTSSLVDRVVNLVSSGVPITGIAAITFTEKAAAELRARLRGELSKRNDESARQALADLDHAPIGTLHAFARRILNDRPVAAGLPPGFGVLDQLQSNLRFDDEWVDLLDDLLAEAEPADGITAGGRRFVDLCDYDRFGVEKGVREIATEFRFNWDLVEERVDDTDPGPLVVRWEPLADIADDIAATPVPEGDKQADELSRIALAAAALRSTDDLLVQLDAIATLSSCRRAERRGNKTNWKHLGVDALHELRDREVDLADRADSLLADVAAYRKRLVGVVCRRFVLGAARDRIAAGLLDFHDLLVHARRLLAHDATIRRDLHERYPRVLLDEFQDTDPIQLEIAVRLTADPDDPAHDDDWRSLRPLPGRLFIVGDPKQSIYRFRRADIRQYLRAAEQVGADTERLTANFRSTDAVIDFTNELFESVIAEDPGRQPAFQRLEASREAPLRGHGSVHLLGADAHADLADRSWTGDHGAADELRRREAVEVAGAVAAALDEGWIVYDEHLEELRACRPGDICVLVPTRLSLPALEAELRSIGVSYRAENAAVVYAAPEVRDLLMSLRAADDPTDELAVVASLRSPVYGCSDVELYEWHRLGGRWGVWADVPEGLESHPVAEALRHLRSVHERIPTVGAAGLLAAIADECRMFDLALAGGDDRDVWRRLRFVIDQARSWADAGGRGVRRYLAWAALQAHEGQVSEAILPEHDHDAVRIMTVHASKGLEFPITIVSGMTTKPRRGTGNEVIWEDDTWYVRGRGDDGSFAEVAPLDELMSDAERRRLLYVACTRAVDHLVVSLHRATDDERNTTEEIGKLTSAELLWRCGALDGDARTRPFAADGSVPGVPQSIGMADVAPLHEWRAELAEVTAAASQRSAIAATRLADEVRMLRERQLDDDPGLDKQPVNIDLPPWQRGRYGTSIGRAVHGTLQFCDLETGDDIDDLARSQCAAEGIIGLDRRVAALARSALHAPMVRRVVAGAEHWRELFIAAPVGRRVLEGYIDLLVRTPEGLVIVDYKTDQWSGPVQTTERVGRYRTQLASYGAALESMLAEPVVAGVLVRCKADGPADEIVVPDWSAAIDEVRALVD